MRIKGLTQNQLEEITEKINKKHKTSLWLVYPSQKGNFIQFTLKLKNCSHPFHRRHTSYNFDGLYSDKRSRHVCWHGHFEFMNEIYNVNPNAIIVTSMIRYNNKDDFDKNNEETAWKNIGSQMFPQYFVEACDC